MIILWENCLCDAASDIIRTINSAGMKINISSLSGLVKKKKHSQDFLALIFT